MNLEESREAAIKMYNEQIKRVEGNMTSNNVISECDNYSEKLNKLFDEVMTIRGEMGTVSAPNELKLIERFTEDLINSMYTFIDRMQILDQERRIEKLREEMSEREDLVNQKRTLIEKRQQAVFASNPSVEVNGPAYGRGVKGMSGHSM